MSPRVTRSKARVVTEEDSSQQVMPISRVKKRPTARRGRRGARVGARGYQMPRSREYAQVVGERDTSTPTSDTSETVQGKTPYNYTISRITFVVKDGCHKRTMDIA